MRPQGHSQGQATNCVTRPLPRFIAKTPLCETVVEFDQLFEGRDGTRGLIRQQSPELRAPFTTGFTPWAGQVVLFARSYTTEDWNNPDDEDD